MPFGISFRRKEEAFDPIIAGHTQALLNSLNPMPANEEQMMKDLEINIHTIKDDGINRRLDNLSVSQPYDLPIEVPDGQGGTVKQTIHMPSLPVGWALAARMAVSPITATRFLSERQAAIYKNRQRAAFLKIKRNMRRVDRELFGDALDQLEQIALQHIDDSVRGQKMLSMKTSGRSVHVGVENRPGVKS